MSLIIFFHFCIQYSETLGEISGYRIVDIGYVFSQILNCTHDGMFGCNFTNMEYVSEFRKGYFSKFLFKCKMCSVQKQIYTSNDTQNSSWPINKAIVNSTIAIGK